MKINVDKLQASARACGAKALPTFQAFKNAQKLGELVGAQPDKLSAFVKECVEGGAAAAKSNEPAEDFGAPGHVRLWSAKGNRCLMYEREALLIVPSQG